MTHKRIKRICAILGCSRQAPALSRICCCCRKRHSRDHIPYKFKPGLFSGRLMKPYDRVTSATKRYRLRKIDRLFKQFGGSDAGCDQLLLDFVKRHPTADYPPSDKRDIENIAGRNIIRHCRNQCYRSPERKRIERILVADAPVSSMAIALQRSEPYIRALKKYNYTDTKITSVAGRKLSVFQYRLPENLIKKIKDWVKKNTEVTSGSKTEQYIQRPTSYDFYLDYWRHAKHENEYIVSPSTLKKIKLDLGVIKRPFDRFDCKKCIAWESIKHHATGMENLENAALLEHQKLKDTQRSFYKYTRDNLKPWMLLLPMDFTQLPTFGTSESEINDLVICYYTRDPATGQVVKKNIDIIGKHKHNWVFVREAIRRLQQIGLFNNYSQIIFWSDGGPHHFKVCKTLRVLPLEINRDQKKIYWEFFAPDHGHSECDAHSGAVKTRISSEVKRGHRPSSLEDFKAIIERVPDTQVIILDRFDETDIYAEVSGYHRRWAEAMLTIYVIKNGNFRKLETCVKFLLNRKTIEIPKYLVRQKRTTHGLTKSTEMELVCGSEADQALMEIEDTKRTTEAPFQVVIRPNVFVNVQPCACS